MPFILHYVKKTGVELPLLWSHMEARLEEIEGKERSAFEKMVLEDRISMANLAVQAKLDLIVVDSRCGDWYLFRNHSSDSLQGAYLASFSNSNEAPLQVAAPLIDFFDLDTVNHFRFFVVPTIQHSMMVYDHREEDGPTFADQWNTVECDAVAHVLLFDRFGPRNETLFGNAHTLATGGGPSLKAWTTPLSRCRKTETNGRNGR